MPRTAVASRPVEVAMNHTEAKINSHRFDAPEAAEGEPRAAVGSLYLRNEAWAEMGEPSEITVTVAARE